jgi:hypothetical protein
MALSFSTAEGRAFYPETVEYLLREACPSIQYRVRRELLSQSETSKEMLALPKEILHDKVVERIAQQQRPDGSLGTRFHTAETRSNYSTEVAIRLLSEKGISRHHPLLSKALRALRGKDERFAREFFRVGRILDSKGFGGSSLIRAALFARAGVENEPFVQEQVTKSLRAFEAVSKVNSVSDLAKMNRGKLVFKPDALWPCIYHLRLLAFTSRWRSSSNIARVAASIRHLLGLVPLPPTYVREKSHHIAPCGVLNSKLGNTTKPIQRDSVWFENMELMSRAGVIKKVPDLQAGLMWLAKVIHANNGKFVELVASENYTKWSAYTGLALEKDWRSKRRRICDLTFRSLLILHHSAA